ncbi:MAG: MaoC/PaaZ C-terminal domain-containing protein [Solirubrobacterales bacterium]
MADQPETGGSSNRESGGSSRSPLSSAGPPRTYKQGDSIPELKVTPDKYTPHRYAGASGDFNPIHIDPDFAKQVGLPGNILHGLWMMAQVARAHTEAAEGDPRALKRLKVQFRGMGFPEQELIVTATIKQADDGVVVTDTVAAQGDSEVIRNAEAELRIG